MENSLIIWLDGKDVQGKDGKTHKLITGSLHLDGKDFDISGFKNVAKSGANYLKMRIQEPYKKPTEEKKEF